MSTRIQVVIDARERDAFRARAQAAGQSLSEWLREAGRERLRRSAPTDLAEPAALDAFFAEREAAELGAEPEWGEHLAVIEASRRGEPRR